MVLQTSFHDLCSLFFTISYNLMNLTHTRLHILDGKKILGA